MTWRLNGKVAIVTGAGSHIGRAGAKRFAAERARGHYREQLLEAGVADETVGIAKRG